MGAREVREAGEKKGERQKKIEGNYSAMLNLAMEKELKGGSQEKKGLLKKSF